jgi:hypothetical protein
MCDVARRSATTIEDARAIAVDYIERRCNLGARIYLDGKLVESWEYYYDGEARDSYAKRVGY